jgi:hypothetical protein
MFFCSVGVFSMYSTASWAALAIDVPTVARAGSPESGSSNATRTGPLPKVWPTAKGRVPGLFGLVAPPGNPPTEQAARASARSAVAASRTGRGRAAATIAPTRYLTVITVLR